MRNRKIQVLILLMLSIGLICFLGCAQRVWVKPGASQNDFSIDKYACMQEAQQPASSARVNRYSGYADSGIQTNWNLFNACMNAKGWYLQSKQQPTISPQVSPKFRPEEDLLKKAKTMCSIRSCENPEKAIEYLDEAIRLKPDFAIAYHDRAFAYTKMKQHELALKDLDEAIRIKPDEAMLHQNRGRTYLNLQQYQSAIKDYDEAIRLKPDMVTAYNGRAFAYAELKQYQSAIKDLDEAIRLKPDYAEAHVGRGSCLIHTGKTEEGCCSLNRACELGNCKRYEQAKQKGDCQ